MSDVTGQDGQRAGSTADNDRLLPPFDLEAEQSTLGALLMTTSRDVVEGVFDIVARHDFYRPAHQMIFESVRRLFDDSQPHDAVSVADDLRKRTSINRADRPEITELDRVGGGTYLHTLIATVPTVANAGYYARIVLDKSKRRNLIDTGTKFVQLGHGPGEIDDILDRAGAEFTAAVTGRETDEGTDIGDIVADIFDDAGNPDIGFPGHRTGFPALDDAILGLQPGDLYIVGARPSIGKTTLLLDFTRALADAGVWTYFAALEMSKKTMGKRYASAEEEIDFKRLMANRVTAEEYRRLTRGLGKMTEAPIRVDSRPNMTVGQIRSGARALRRSRGLGLVVVDYLQIMGGSGRTFERRELEVAENAAALKQLARELEVPVVAAVQLNRDVEKRASMKPVLSDIRESGAIEQAADVVILIHREDQVDKDSTRKGEADLIIAKNRNGERGKEVAVAAKLHYAKFEHMPDDDDAYGYGAEPGGEVVPMHRS